MSYPRIVENETDDFSCDDNDDLDNIETTYYTLYDESFKLTCENANQKMSLKKIKFVNVKKKMKNVYLRRLSFWELNIII